MTNNDIPSQVDLNICVLSTPFQLKMLKNIISTYGLDRLMIIKTGMMKDYDLDIKNLHSTVSIDTPIWNLKDFFSHFPHSVPSYRKSTAILKEQVRKLIHNLGEKKKLTY
ncbi:MAG TPA: hypothetical protein ACFCUD_03620 [Cyclobacteriaceae bacterium]